MNFLAACGGVCGLITIIAVIGVIGFWLFGKVTMWRSSRRMDLRAAAERP